MIIPPAPGLAGPGSCGPAGDTPHLPCEKQCHPANIFCPHIRAPTPSSTLRQTLLPLTADSPQLLVASKVSGRKHGVPCPGPPASPEHLSVPESSLLGPSWVVQEGLTLSWLPLSPGPLGWGARVRNAWGPPLPPKPGSTHTCGQPWRIVYIFEPRAKVPRHKQETGSLACAPFSGAFTYYKELPPPCFSASFSKA